MVEKYRFGHPFETEAVVMDIPCQKEGPSYGAVSLENGFRFDYQMEKGQVVYGLGEALRGINKRGYHYVSYNLDHDFLLEDALSLYGAHNFLLLSGDVWVGLFFDYPGKIAFDIGYTLQDWLTVTCDYADLYLYVITGEGPMEVVTAFRRMIGRSYIPPKWAMGFAQSRWGYKKPEDFYKVADTYRELHIPLDAIYMDIDYMDRYKDFTVDAERFPDFPAFVETMKAKGIHLVPIIDAAVKIERGYSVCDEGVEKGYFCTDATGETPFQTAAWPGKTYLPDVLNPEARAWFGAQYRSLIDQGIEGFWNDMNEPSIFYTAQSAEEYRESMKRFLDTSEEETDLTNFQWKIKDPSSPENYQQFYHRVNGTQVCHNLVHNLYGYNMTRAAGEAFARMYPGKRFLLFSRSSYIGMHRYGGIWTGDNKSWWTHLLLNIRMMPSLNMCGFLYAGADLGGFGCDVTRDLLLRWLAFGVFTPLMRNHSASNTRDQECYQFEKPEDFAHVISVRYRLLPYLYSEYVKAAVTHGMYFRPLGFDYPTDRLAVETEDQLMLGDGLMVSPVYLQNASGRCVYLPEDMLFVKFLPDGTIFQKNMAQGIHYIAVELNEVPLFIKKNHIVPVAAPAETVSQLDEQNLTVLGWLTEPASYQLYRDDGYSMDYDHPAHYTTITKEPGTFAYKGVHDAK